VQPVAEVDLLLTEENRSFHPTDVRLGRLALHSLRVDPLAQASADRDAYLVKLNYEIEFEPDMPTPVWVELGIACTTEDVLVSDAWPRKVTEPAEPARLAITQLLDFITYTPDLAGLLHDQVPVPALTPAIGAFGIGGSRAGWRHSGDVKPESHSGWLIVSTPASCREVHMRVIANHDLVPADTWGLRPRGTDDTLVVRLPHLRSPDGIRYRLGFTVDVVGYSARTIQAQQQVQARLDAILRRFVAKAGIDHFPDNFQYNGDGFHYFVPDSDPYKTVKHLLITLPALLSEDNQAHDDRIRLRMATDVGTVGLGPLGFTGDAVVRFSRLVDSQPLRNAVRENDTDFVALVSDTLYRDIITRFDDLATLPFQEVDVEVKNYQARAHLLVCPS
jgi:hypothetical protein